jgi:choline dehydrogenase-like flavoprotein
MTDPSPAAPKQFVNGRIVGGCSLHAAETPGRCQPYHHPCPEPRCVDCCGIEDDRDIMECPHCGKQWATRCTFDEDYS